MSGGRLIQLSVQNRAFVELAPTYATTCREVLHMDFFLAKFLEMKNSTPKYNCYWKPL